MQSIEKKKQILSHRKWNGGLVTLRRLTDSRLVGFFSLSALHVWMFIRKHEWRPSVDSLSLFEGGVKNENCNMGIMFRFVAKGSDIDENYVNTSISNSEGGKKWRYIHQSSLKKKIWKVSRCWWDIWNIKNMIDVRGYIVKRNSLLMIFNYLFYFLHSGWSPWWVWTGAILRTKPCDIPLGIRPESQGKTMSWCLPIRCHCLVIKNRKRYWFFSSPTVDENCFIYCMMRCIEQT